MRPPTLTKPSIDLDTVNAQLAEADALTVIQWAAETFGPRLVMTSSFGAQAAVLLHLATRVVPDIAVIWIDTGYLFPETYQFADQLTKRLGLNLKVYSGLMTPAHQEALYGRLWEKGTEGLDQYHQINKIEPMQRALQDLNVGAWMAGLRRQQTTYRATLRPVEQQNERYKVHPILTWTTKQVHDYLTHNDLPYHPLYEKGYASIGDVQLTRPITDNMSERDGRFHGLKQECGLHLPESTEESQSRDSSGL